MSADGTGTPREHRGRERAVVATTERLAAIRMEPVPADSARGTGPRASQTGGRQSAEQRGAIELAGDEHPLVVIEGHAGNRDERHVDWHRPRP